MTLTVHRVSLSSAVQKDHETAQRPLSLPFSALRKSRIQWFYILDVKAKRPEELDRSVHRGIKESAIHVPATTESLIKIQRAFDVHPEPCRFGDLQIRHCSNNIAIIIYSISTAIKPKGH